MERKVNLCYWVQQDSANNHVLTCLLQKGSDLRKFPIITVYQNNRLGNQLKVRRVTTSPQLFAVFQYVISTDFPAFLTFIVYRITESWNCRGWKGPTSRDL